MGAAASTAAIAGPLALGSPLGIAFALGMVFGAAVANVPSPSDIHGKPVPDAASDDADQDQPPVSSPCIVNDNDFLVTSYTKLVQVCTDVAHRVRDLLRAAASAVKNAAARVWDCLKNAAATVRRMCVELAWTACGEELAAQTARYMDLVSRCAARAGGGISMSKACALITRSVEVEAAAATGGEPASSESDAATARRAAATAAAEMIRSVESVGVVEGVMIPAEVMAAIGVLAVGSALCLSVFSLATVAAMATIFL